jgi:hypothetical protein
MIGTVHFLALNLPSVSYFSLSSPYPTFWGILEDDGSAVLAASDENNLPALPYAASSPVRLSSSSFIMRLPIEMSDYSMPVRVYKDS